MSPETHANDVVQHEPGSVDQLMHLTGLDGVIWPMAVIFGAMLVAYRIGRYVHIVWSAPRA